MNIVRNLAPLWPLLLLLLLFSWLARPAEASSRGSRGHHRSAVASWPKSTHGHSHFPHKPVKTRG